MLRYINTIRFASLSTRIVIRIYFSKDMKESYWFKRAHSTEKPFVAHSESFLKHKSSKQDILPPDDSLKHQIKSAALRLL